MHLLVNTINLNLKRLTKPSSLVLLFNVNSRRPLYLSSSLFNNETTTPPPSVSEDPAGNSVFLKKKYSDTLLLPKTDFPMKVAHAKREEHENTIANVSSNCHPAQHNVWSVNNLYQFAETPI